MKLASLFLFLLAVCSTNLALSATLIICAGLLAWRSGLMEA
jgi:hypothetical protein